MRTTILLFFLFFLMVNHAKSESGNEQSIQSDKNLWTLGAGYPFFLNSKSYFENQGYANYRYTQKNLSIFIEKPDLLYLTKTKRNAVIPGIAFYAFHNDRYTSNLAGDYSSDLIHKGISIYTRLDQVVHCNQKEILYFGIMGGTFLFTESDGKISYNYRYPQIRELKISRNGKAFFNSFFTGLYTGCKLRIPEIAPVKTAIEASYYPWFASPFHFDRDSNKPDQAEGMFSISVKFDFSMKFNKREPNQK